MPFMTLDMYKGDGWIVELSNGESTVLVDRGNDVEPGQKFSNGDIRGTVESVAYVKGWFGHFSAAGYMDQTEWCYDQTKSGLLEQLQVLPASELLLGGPGLSGYAYQADVYCTDCGEDLVRRACEESTGDSDYIREEDAEDTETCPQPIFFGEHEVAQHCADCGEYLYGPQEETTDDVDESDTDPA